MVTKLYSTYPKTVTEGKKRHSVKPYFNRVLKAMEVMSTYGISDYDKIEMCSRLICGKPAIIGAPILNAFFESLKSEEPGGEQSIDFEQDAGYIRAAFMQTYGIRLEEWFDKMTWYEFVDLFQGLPDNTKIMQIVDIRMRPLPESTKYNAKEIATLQELKTKYRIKNKKVDYSAVAKGWNKVFDSLKGR